MKIAVMLKDSFKAITNVTSQGDAWEECNGWAADNRINDCPSAYPLSIRCRYSRQTTAFANNHWQGQAVETAQR
jgi:hypothetical protein